MTVKSTRRIAHREPQEAGNAAAKGRRRSHRSSGKKAYAVRLRRESA